MVVYTSHYTLKVKLVASLNLARVASLSLLGNFAHGLSCTWAPFESARCSHNAPGQKRIFIGEVSTKWVHGIEIIAVVLVGWWLITKVWRARLDIVRVCSHIAAWHDFLGQRYLACSYVFASLACFLTSTTTTLRIASWAQRWLSAIGRWAWRSLK